MGIWQQMDIFGNILKSKDMKRTSKKQETGIKLYDVTGNDKKKVKVWKDDIPVRAYRLSLLGLTNEEMGVAFGVSVNTFNQWLRTRDDLRKAVELGRQEADSRVVQSLYKKATGYTFEEDNITVSHGQVIVTRVKKYAHPETTAAIFWLKNRQKEKWADVWKVDQNVQISVQKKEADLTDLTTEELQLMEKLGLQNFKLEQ